MDDVTPPDNASTKPTSAGLMPSSARKPGAVGVGHLVGVVAGPPLAVLAYADVCVRLDETGQYPASRRIHLGDAVRHVDIGRGADRRDLAVSDQHPFRRRRVHRQLALHTRP